MFLVIIKTLLFWERPFLKLSDIARIAVTERCGTFCTLSNGSCSSIVAHIDGVAWWFVRFVQL